jgi:Rieske Fe-S protein
MLKCGAAVAALPALSALSGCAPRVATPLAIDVAAPAGTIVSVALSRVPEILTTGSSLLLHPDGKDSFGRPLSFLVVNSAKEGLLAFDGYCTHSACEVAWDAAADEVVCPCHLSRFDVSGRVLQAPAKDDLTPFAAKIQHENQLLSVDIGDVAVAPAFPAPVDGKITFALADLPALEKIGGSVTGHAQGVVFPIIVLRTGAGALAAFNARCTHQGCSVYGTGAQLLICKCHGSLFGADGGVKLGPATLPLTPLEVLTFDGTTAVVKVA